MSIIKKIKYFKWVKNAKDLIINQNNELIWAETWKSTIQGIDWLTNPPSLSPGRWAVGYNYLYVLTRILNEIKPSKILDIGLGVTTVLISRYFEKEDVGEHLIIEHDKDWIEFYLKNRNLSLYSHVNQVELQMKTEDEKKQYYYEGLASILENKKFEVISIDAPFGSEINSRADILAYLPQILEKEFVIIMDDTERVAEQETLKKITDNLRDHGIKTWTGTYKSIKNCTVIASEKYRYICTM